eukprot:4594007-Amphidinium_carterae.2
MSIEHTAKSKHQAPTVIQQSRRQSRCNHTLQRKWWQVTTGDHLCARCQTILLPWLLNGLAVKLSVA